VDIVAVDLKEIGCEVGQPESMDSGREAGANNLPIPRAFFKKSNTETKNEINRVFTALELFKFYIFVLKALGLSIKIILNCAPSSLG
jgi:hypothetical protein